MSLKNKMGIDVSKHNGKILWNQVASAGYSFALIRAGYGNSISQVDAQFNYNITNALKNNLKVGVYWFSYAISEDDARKEAEVCNEVIKQYKDKITMGVYFDYEYDSATYYKKQKGVSPTKEFINQVNIAFGKRIEELGYESGIYFNNDYAKNILTQNTLNQFKYKWLADYSGSPDYHCDIQQTTSKGVVSGINGNVDINKCYSDFNLVSTDDSFVSDTTNDFCIMRNAYYTFKITASHEPKMIFGTSNVLKIDSITNSGNDYYIKIQAVGGSNTGTGVYVNGKKLLVVNVYPCDTTQNIQIRKLQSYVMACYNTNVTTGNSDIITTNGVQSYKNEYLIKLTANGNVGEATGIYVDGKKMFVARVV